MKYLFKIILVCGAFSLVLEEHWVFGLLFLWAALD